MSDLYLIQQRVGTSTQWATSNAILPDFLLGFVSDSLKAKLGDGITPWNDLEYINLSSSEIDNIKASLEGNIQGLGNDLETLQTDLGTIEGDVSTMKTDWSIVQGNIETLQTNFGTVSSEVSEIKTDIIDIQNDVDASKDNISELFSRFQADDIERLEIKWEHPRGENEFYGNHAVFTDHYGFLLMEDVQETISFNYIEIPIWALNSNSAGTYKIRYTTNPDVWWALPRFADQSSYTIAEGTIPVEDMAHSQGGLTVIRLNTPITVTAGSLLAVAVTVDDGIAKMPLWNETIIPPETDPPRRRWWGNITGNHWDSLFNLIDLAAQRAPVFRLSTLTIEEQTGFNRGLFNEFLPPEKIEDYSIPLSKIILEGSEFMQRNLLNLEEYEKHVDREKYQIYKPKEDASSKVVAVLRNVAVKLNTSNGEIVISVNGINGEYDNVTIFNSSNFPELLPGSSIEHILLLPWTRNMISVQHGKNWRMCVITNKGQIYHNFPSRDNESDGTVQEGDITTFEESVIWDLPERKFPSTNASASGVEHYFPCLPSENYEHHPILNTDGSFEDTYGNGGFGLSVTQGEKTFPRFYRTNLSGRNWCSFRFMGGYEPGDKLSIIGTYVGNDTAGNGARICVFATDDGGRSWYNKYEFCDPQGIGYLAWGNNINTSSIASAYTTNAFKLNKRAVNSPDSSTKEPTTKFTLGEDIVISDISRANPAVVTTSTSHGLVSGNVIVIKSNSGSASDWEWMLNNDFSTTDGGNGILFKVKVLNSTTFELYEYVHSAHNNISARHIHAISRCKDGWTINCGEQYPDGWVLYMQAIESDSYAIRRAHSDINVYRLTSSENSVQRTMGSILLDDEDGTFIFASDNEISQRNDISLPEGRTDEVSRSSTGVFIGALSDVDDMSKFYPLAEFKETVFFFKEKKGILFAIGQRGEFAISFDMGQTWEWVDVSLIGNLRDHFYGETDTKIVIVNDIIIAIK